MSAAKHKLHKDKVAEQGAWDLGSGDVPGSEPKRLASGDAGVCRIPITVIRYSTMNTVFLPATAAMKALGLAGGKRNRGGMRKSRGGCAAGPPYRAVVLPRKDKLAQDKVEVSNG